MDDWDSDLPRYWGVGSRPFVPPRAPSRFLERMWFSFAGLTFMCGGAAVVYMPYDGVEIGLIGTTILLALLYPIAFVIAGRRARGERLRAETEVARYEQGMRGIASES